MGKGERERDLLEKAYKLGFEYEKTYRGCAQSVIAAIQDTLGIQDDRVFKAATGLSGGGGGTGIGFCGSCTGGIMVLSQLRGRERSKFEDPEKIRFQSSDLAKKLVDQFIHEFGTVICRDIQTKIFGRPFYLKDPDEFAKFEKAGAHEGKCPDVVGKAAQMAVRIILDEKLVAL